MTKNTKILWFSLLFASLLGIIFMIISTYSLEGVKSFKNGEEISRTGKNIWKEYLIFPFYFTFISNIFALIVSLWMNLNIFKNIKNYNIHLHRLKLLMAISLTITLIVYWTLLAPSSIGKMGPFLLITNILVHGITPILSIFVYIYEIIKNKNKKFNLQKTFLITILMPLIWIINATIIYYSLGKSYPDAIYSFLRYAQNPIWLSIVYLVGITIIFSTVSYLYIKINNKF